MRTALKRNTALRGAPGCLTLIDHAAQALLTGLAVMMAKMLMSKKAKIR